MGPVPRYAFCAALAALVILLSALFQRPNAYNGGLGGDGAQYARLAEQCWHEPMRTAAPFARRIGVPCLAALLPVEPKYGLWIINVTGSILLLFLVDAWLRRHVAGRIVPWILAGFAFHWLTPLRHVWWYPTYIDTLALCAIVGALLLKDKTRHFAVVCFLGALVRESVLIVPLALLTGQFVRPQPRRWAAALSGVAAWAAGMLVAQFLSTSTTDYWLPDNAYYWAFSKPVPVYVLAFFIAFGPALALLAVKWTEMQDHLWNVPEDAVMLAFVAVLALIGGSDTERFLLWGSPIVLVLIGRAAEQINWARARGPLALLIIGQAINGRWFLRIPDYWEQAPRAWPILTPWTAGYYEFLFSHTPDKLMAAVAVAQYAFVTLVLFIWLKWTSTRRYIS